MKKRFYAILTMVALLCVSNARSQNFIVAYCSGLPGGTQSTTYGPMYSVATANATSRLASIYPASQLSTIAGAILTNAYFHTGTGHATGMLGTPNFKIYLKEVTASNWGSSGITWATEIAGATLVYDTNPASAVGTGGGWKNFVFSTTFTYSGTQNLAVFLEYQNTSASNAINWSYEYTSPCVSGSTTGTETKYSNVTTGIYPATLSSTNSRRPYIGFDFVYPPCVTPPTAGAALASNATPCSGQNITLSLTNNTFGSGQTYQWESATSLSGPWTLEGSAQTTPSISVAPPVGTTYYRCQVTCGASTATSVQDTVTVPLPYPGGTYTINSAVATGGTNFQSFTAAMSAISCGISGPVVFNVTAGSGPYTEQIILPNTVGSNATNRITIHGNGATVQHSASAASTAVLMMDGVDYVKIDSLIFKSMNATNGSGVMLYNDCDHDTITRCTFDLSSVTATTATNFGIRISTTPTTTSTTLSGASNTLISNCRIIGNAAGNNGIYYGLYAYGPNANNVYEKNTISNCYLYSGYIYYGDQNIITKNHITRQTKTGTGYCYGLVTSNLTAGSSVTKNKIEYLGGSSNNASYCYPLQVLANAGTAVAPVLVANNVVSNMTSVPLNGGIYIAGSYVDLYHNTVEIDLPLTYSTTSVQSGIYNGSTTANIKNNIVSYKGGAPNTKQGLYYSSTPATSDYNNVYMNSTVAGAQHYGYRTTNYSTLSAFQSATSLEANGHDYDPALVSSGGLPVPTSSAMDNMGTPVASVADDILGMPRNGTSPDVGALEYVPPTCPPASAPTVISTATTTASIGWTANPGTTLWQIEYAQGNTFAIGTGTRLIVNSNPYTLGSVTPLLPSTQYTYFVRDICAPNDTSLWSSRSPVITTIATCDTPTALLSSNITTNSADLDWTENGTATQWQIEYAVGTAFALGTGTRVMVSSKPYTLTSLTQGTGYSYFVRSVCGPNDTSVWSTRSAGFTTLVACPSPTAIGFANVTANSFDVTWTATTGTELLEYGPTGHVPGVGATAGPGGTIVTNVTSPYTISGLTPGTGYDVFIRQDCSASSNGFSANLSRNAATTGAPVNDTICGALNVPLNSTSTVWVNTNNATVTATDPSISGCTTPNNNAWFKFTTTAAGVYTITAYSSQITSYSTYYGNMSAWMWLYSSAGSCPSIALTEISHMTLCNASLYAPAQYPVPPNASRSYSTPSLAASSTYYFVVDGADGSYGNIGFQVAAPLDAKLGTIAAKNAGKTNVIDWNTLSETSGDRFELERSIDGRNFSRIYERKANGAASRYSYIDSDPAKGINYYRLRLIAANGSTTYSETVSAFVKSSGFEVEAFPNPVSHDLTVKVTGVQGADAALQVTDLTGKVLKTLKMNAGVETIDMSGLANGIYLIRYSDVNHTRVMKVNKQ